MILDVTSGLKKWPEFADIRVDIERRLKPDIVASACYLPFKDESFDEMYCHPPFVVNGNSFLGRFAYWFHKADWRGFLHMTDAEFSRCLKPSGKLHYQVDEGWWWGMAHYSDILRLASFVVEKDEAYLTNSPRGNTMRHFLTMKRT